MFDENNNWIYDDKSMRFCFGFFVLRSDILQPTETEKTKNYSFFFGCNMIG